MNHAAKHLIKVLKLNGFILSRSYDCQVRDRLPVKSLKLIHKAKVGTSGY